MLIVVGCRINDHVYSDDLAFCVALELAVSLFGLLQRRAARVRHEATHRMMRVVVPQTIVVVLRADRSTALQL